MERWEIIASFPNYDDSIHCRSLAFSVYASYQNTPTPWQQRQAAGKGCFSKEEKEWRAPPFFPRQTWCSSWAVTRTHHTHCLCSHPQMRSLKIACPPLRLSLTLHHLHVNFSPGCHLPTVINLSGCVAIRIRGLSLDQVLILLQCTRLEPPDWSVSRCLCFLTTNLYFSLGFRKPWRTAAVILLMKKQISRGFV